MLKIADFFNIPQDQQPANKAAAASKSTTSTSSKSKTSLPPQNVKADKPTQMTLNLKLEKPDIILVEHMDNINTQAIIVNVSLIIISVMKIISYFF